MNQHLSLILFLFFVLQQQQCVLAHRSKFMGINGVKFMLNGKPYYANGFNAYWLMYMASNLPGRYGRSKVYYTFRQAASRNLTVARTWAFSDGGSSPLQISPGFYNEQMFKGLDYVVYAANRNGIKLILSLVNNYQDFGGKAQYVQWAQSQSRGGPYLKSEDDFFTNRIVKGYYKNHIKKVLNRINTFNGVLYKNDPTIMAWELMNEPRCNSENSYRIIQAWIREMAWYVKSIDRNHMVEVGLEGFYNPASHRARFNPNAATTGTDFIANNKVSNIDFATLHAYPDAWLSNSNDGDQLLFLQKWLDQHIRDAQRVLNKPLLIAEFGKSRVDRNYNVLQRDAAFKAVYDRVLNSARRGGPAGGSLFWQLLAKGMESYADGYAITFEEKSSTVRVITQEAGHLYAVKRKRRVPSRSHPLAGNP